MICKKCGAELDKAYDFCPKCGNKLKRKHKAGKIIGIVLLLLICGSGAALYVSGYYKDIAAGLGWIVEEPIAEVSDNRGEDMEIIPTDSAKPKETEKKAAAEKAEVEEEAAEEEPDELELFLNELSFEPIEMTMGEIYQVELEREIKDISWSSSDEKVVKAADGKLMAIMPGISTVTLSAGGREIPLEVTVNAFSDMTLAVNCSKTMELNEMLSNVRWESSVPEIVSAEDGVISSLSAGASTVTAYIDEVPYSFEVVATTPDITTTSVRKIIGNTEQISILGTNGKAEWKSDNTAIATVSDTGLITAEPTGAGQNTVVHAYVDGMEFRIDVAVEPIPQLSSTYKMYGHQDNSKYKNAKITICTNANETITYTGEVHRNGNGGYIYINCENVLNVADVDYSRGEIYPLYHAFYSYTDDENHTDIYLVGTSQVAEVLVQRLDYYYSDDAGLSQNPSKANSVATYEACDNYGIIHIYNHDYPGRLLVTVAVDGYQYQFVVDYPSGADNGGLNYY